MKKQFLILAGSALILSSCGSNNTETPAQTQAQIDSAVNAKLAEHDAANAAKNDSTLRAIEAEKAAAMAKEAESKTTTTTTKNNGNGKTKTKTVTTTTKTVEPTPPPPPAKTTQDDKFDRRSGNNTTTSGQSKSDAEQKAQDDKFERRGK